MCEPDDRYDRLILWIVKHVPVRGILVLAPVSYLGFGLALPLALGWPALWLVAANLWGTIFAPSLLSGWLFVQIQARDRRHLLDICHRPMLLDHSAHGWWFRCVPPG